MKFETSDYLRRSVELSEYESFEFIDGEYFDMLDGNSLLTIPVKHKYLFVAIFDSGYCGSFTVHSIHTNVCPEQQFGSVLMPKRYSSVSRDRINVDSRNVSCAPNSQVNNFVDQIVKFCAFHGNWQSRTPAERDQQFCACNPGFFASDAQTAKVTCTR